MQGWKATARQGVTRGKRRKDKKHLGKLFRKDLKIKCQATSDLKAFRL